MSIFSELGKLFKSGAVQRARVEVLDSNISVRNFQSGVEAKADEHYIRLWISELFLKNASIFGSKRFPLAYSLVGLNYGGQRVEFANVSGKNKFDIKQADVGQSILRNYPLTPLLPFRGGTSEIDCGLVSMEGDNVLKAFAGVVSDLAGKLNAPQVASVIDIAGSVASGVQDLLGAGKAKTVLYVHDTFAPPRSGFTLLSGKKQSQIKPEQIWITDNGIRAGASKNALVAIDPQDYLVLRIDCPSTRDDWRSLPTISKPFEQALVAKVGGDDEKGKLFLAQAKVAAVTSTDLIKTDRVRAVQGMEAEYNESASLTVRGAQLLMKAVKRISPDEARAFDWDEVEMISNITNSSNWPPPAV